MNRRRRVIGHDNSKRQFSGVVSECTVDSAAGRCRRRTPGVSPVRVYTLTGRFISASGASRLRAIIDAERLCGEFVKRCGAAGCCCSPFTGSR